jgi:pimeloyl-ACP methyl ester carboxylesterase
MPVLQANGIDIYYEAYGDGQAILGIHGTPSSAVLWADAAQRLADHGRCFIYDRRGFGRSGRHKPFTATDLVDQVADAAGLLDVLAAGPAVVIGRSTGGQIALELARQRPDRVRALVLLEPALFTVDPVAEAWASRVRERVLATTVADPALASEAVIREALGNAFWTELPAELRDVFAEASPAVLAEIHGRGLDLSEDPLRLTAEELATLDQPTLVIAAQESPEALRLVADKLAVALPRARRAIVTGGHLIDPAGDPVLRFLADLGAPEVGQRWAS